MEGEILMEGGGGIYRKGRGLMFRTVEEGDSDIQMGFIEST